MSAQIEGATKGGQKGVVWSVFSTSECRTREQVFEDRVPWRQGLGPKICCAKGNFVDQNSLGVDADNDQERVEKVVYSLPTRATAQFAPCWYWICDWWSSDEYSKKRGSRALSHYYCDSLVSEGR